MEIEKVMEEGEEIGKKRKERRLGLGENLIIVIGEGIIKVMIEIKIEGILRGKIWLKIKKIEMNMELMKRGKGREEKRKKREFKLMRKEKENEEKWWKEKRIRIIREGRILVDRKE